MTADSNQKRQNSSSTRQLFKTISIMFQNFISHYLATTGYLDFQPKAVMFDMDGVIYDSMPYHARSWHTAMQSIGIEMPPEDAYRYEGMRGVETIQLLFSQQRNENISEEEAKKIYKLKSDAFNACPTPSLMPGIKELMEKVKASGLKIVIVTGSAQHTLLDKLDHDLKGLVSRNLVVCANDVEKGKPDPEPYLKGLQKAGVEPWQAIVVENAPLGVRAAVAAHVFIIAVNTGPLPDSILQAEGANMIFPSVAALAGEFRLG